MAYQLTRETIERIYAGWYGKIIGIRLGAPMEGWPEERIRQTLGEMTGYTADYINFAADDDSNGPLFYLRAVEDAPKDRPFCAQDVAEALLNYAPYEHGFFWWGGYGVSTEHTAYLNLRAGIPAPRSGSIEQNGATIAEQIGGQIFIDSFGLAAPGNPELAADMAGKSASVSHDRNGIYGARFVAGCISLAFVENDPAKLMERALALIPADCEYARGVRAVMDFRKEHPTSGWRDCFQFVHDNFGYDKYPGACHIIPNACVMALALLYGEGDFSRSVCVCCMCGWDTDCNVGQIGTILGVMRGLEGIDYDHWRKPINDLLICSSVLGTLNIQDIPYGADYMARTACRLAGQEPPEPFRTLWAEGLGNCHFEYPGSTHALRTRTADGRKANATLENTDEAAHTGSRSLRLRAWSRDESPVYVYQKTYYTVQDFSDSRYDPCLSPLLYPGQTVRVFAMASEQGTRTQACAYAHDARSGQVIAGPMTELTPGAWTELSVTIPPMAGALLDEAGVCCQAQEWPDGPMQVYLDDMRYEGAADYTLRFDRETDECWNFLHHEISQMTRLKGYATLADERLQLSCADFGAVYTGRHDWKDYAAEFTFTPVLGECHYANVRVQGAIRSYAVGFDGAGALALLKNENGWRRLQSVPFAWEPGQRYRLSVTARGNKLEARCGDATIAYTDTENPYLEGCVGLSVERGSHLSCESIRVSPIEA